MADAAQEVGRRASRSLALVTRRYFEPTREASCRFNADPRAAEAAVPGLRKFWLNCESENPDENLPQQQS
jgi:hypothetical protein